VFLLAQTPSVAIGVFSAQGTGNGSIDNVFLQYGAVGAVALIFVGIAWILFKKFEETLKFEREGRKRAEDEIREVRKRAEDEIRESNAYIRDKALPVLQQNSAVMEQFLRASWRDGRDHDPSPR
jgi:flagellar motility protein MotE (MotC chaperone)